MGLFVAAELGRGGPTLEMARGLKKELSQIGFAPLQARYLYALGSLQLGAGDLFSAQTNLSLAVDLAGQLRDESLLQAIFNRLMERHRAELKISSPGAQDPSAGRQAEAIGGERLLFDPGMFGELKRHLGDTTPAVMMLQTGLFHRDQGRPDLAREYLLRSLALNEQEGPAPRFDTALAQEITGRLYLASGEYEEAFHHFRQALIAREGRFGRDHPGLSSALEPLVDILLIRGELDEGKKHALRLAAILEKSFGAGHPELASVHILLARLALRAKEPAQALKLYQSALVSRESIFGRDSPELAELLAGIGEVQLMQKDPEQARANLERAISLGGRGTGEDDLGLASCLEGLGQVESLEGDLARSLSSQQRAYRIREKVLGLGNPDTARSGRRIGEVLLAQQRPGEAAQWLTLSLRQEESLGVDPHEIGTTSFLLAKALGEAPASLKYAVALGERAMHKYLEAEGDNVYEKQEVSEWLQKFRKR